jgi:nucleoside-diphosphate-sugar epimerase
MVVSCADEAASTTVPPMGSSGAVDAVPLRRVLVTGAAGRIGSAFAAQSAAKYRLILADLPGKELSAIKEYGKVVPADLKDFDAAVELCRDVDTVVHLAGEPSPKAEWRRLSAANIEMCYNLFTAAADGGCRRLIFASSVHAVSGYPADKMISSEDHVSPGDLYGVTKVFGEALGRYLATARGISVIVLRIGAFVRPGTTGQNRSWEGGEYLAPRDLCDLIGHAVEADDDIKYIILNAVSENEHKRLDISKTADVLGYDPQFGFPGRMQGKDALSSRLCA